MDDTEQQVGEFLRKKLNGKLHHREDQELRNGDTSNDKALAFICHVLEGEVTGNRIEEVAS
jgi:hypothetical protein